MITWKARYPARIIKSRQERIYLGAFKNYVDKKSWMGGQQKVHACPPRVEGWSMECPHGPKIWKNRSPWIVLNIWVIGSFKCAQIYPRIVLIKMRYFLNILRGMWTFDVKNKRRWYVICQRLSTLGGWVVKIGPRSCWMPPCGTTAF